ncbi:MAG: hypothetical protein HKN19_03080 [Halioglobus sp.]|nr:hypothetical protein [Halioglobus sp.]
MRRILFVLLLACLSGCAGYEVKNLLKSDVDMVTDQFIEESRSAVQELVVKLYARNPAELHKNPGMTVEGRLAQLRVHRFELKFDELDGAQDVVAMNLAFDPYYRGDRVFALAVGLGSMLRRAYQYKPEMFLTDSLDTDVLMTSARNVEVLLWKLKNARKPNGEHYLITHEYRGVVDNLSFERLFGKIIVLQEMMARIAGDSSQRTVTGAVYAVGKVFIPLPI